MSPGEAVILIRRGCSMTTENRPDLATLYALEKIVSAIEKAGTKLSATRLKRDHGFSDKIFAAAADHGCAIKCIRWNDRNMYSFIKSYTIPEEAFYDLVKEQLGRLWIEDKHEASQFYIENTSRRDSKIIGPWTRPDFTIVSYKKFPWTIGHEFDVVTFEVKRPDSANVLAVFEALAHATAATRAYVLFPMSMAEWNRENAEQAKRVQDECARHGVGLILIEDPFGEPTPIHVQRALKREIDHEKCSSFLEAVLSSDGKNKISQWK
jgi:hypothetical protein